MTMSDPWKWTLRRSIFLALLATLVSAEFTDPHRIDSNETIGGSLVIYRSTEQARLSSNARVLVIPGVPTLSTQETVIKDRYNCSGLILEIFDSLENTGYVSSSDNTTNTYTAAPEYASTTIFVAISPLGLPTGPNSSIEYHRLNCSLDWDDGYGQQFDIKQKTKVFKNTYSTFGIYNIKAYCEYKKSGVRRTIRCPFKTTSCVSTTNILENHYRSFNNPFLFLTSHEIKVDTYMSLTSEDCEPEFFWSVTEVGISSRTPFLDFIQPNSSVLTIPKEKLDPATYVVSVEVQFPAKGEDHWFADEITIRVVLPELIAHIEGGEQVDLPHGGFVTINANRSTDLAENVTSVASVSLETFWQFAYYTSVNVYQFRHEPQWIDLIRSFSCIQSIPTGGNVVHITNGTDYALQIDTSVFPTYTKILVMFTIRRGDRSATALQIITFIPRAVPISIRCVVNCIVGRRLFNKDKIELDTTIDPSVNVTNLRFRWITRNFTSDYYSNYNYFDKYMVAPVTGFTSRSLSLPAHNMIENEHLEILLKVSGFNYRSTYIHIFRTVNSIPRGGECTVNIHNVTSARDWVTLTCPPYSRTDGCSRVNDTNAFMTYVAFQQTDGALVEKEPILSTRMLRSYIILKVGDPRNFYMTTLTVEVSDMYNNVAGHSITVTSRPAFKYYDVSNNEEGADIIRGYTQAVYPLDQKKLEYFGKNDLVVFLVSAVCSNIHLVNLPPITLPVPPALNSNGEVLDLQSDGSNKPLESLDIALEETFAGEADLDPATIAIMEVIKAMLNSVDIIVKRDLLNQRSGDKFLASILSNAVTNIAAKSQYINSDTDDLLVSASGDIGPVALNFPDETVEDVSAQLEKASCETFKMARNVVNAVVPNILKSIRKVSSLAISRLQILAMLDVIGGNMSLDTATISPDERSFLYFKMQKVLAREGRGKKKVAKSAAKMAVKLARGVMGKFKLCDTCNNEDNKCTKQLVRKNNVDVIKTTESITPEASQVRADGIQEALANSSSATDEILTVSAIELQENAYMYDEDGTSTTVTSNVLRVDINTPTTQVTPGYLTFDQKVETPDAITYDPNETLIEGDSSEFSYHKYIYGTNTDYTCFILQPLGDYNFTAYEVYFRLAEPPSVLDYDFKFNVRKSRHWQRCISPDSLKGHIGTTYFAVSAKDYVKAFKYNLTMVTVGCLTWSENETKWYTDKCELEWVPQYNKITCFCSNVTDLIFANSFLVAPNSIDFSTVFLRFSPLSQAAVMGAMSVIFVIYAIVLIFLRRKDALDKYKWAVTPLRDNFIADSHYYLVKVYTGMRRGAGTTSRVAYILTGSSGDTGPRELFDGVRKGFSTGSVMTFLMTTSKDLGHLQHLYIWHDNSGKEDLASWYINQLVVYDVSRKLTYTFSAERWLSVSTTVDANIVATQTEEPVKFESRFFSQTRERLSESHMWISMWYRPSLSTFTRVQRASCALVYIFLTMIANAMFYNPSPNYETPPLVQLGPFRFTAQQLFTSVVSALITTPPVMILIFLFKRSRRRSIGGHAGCCRCRCTCSFGFPCCRTRSKVALAKKKYDDALKSIILSEETPDFNGRFSLPSGFIYVAWTFFVAGTVVPAFFVLLYSMEWGKQKSEEWLTSFLMSIVESMIFVDPIMVLCMSLVLACLFRSSAKDTNVDVDIVIQNYQKRLTHWHGTPSQPLALVQNLMDYITLMMFGRETTLPLQGEGLDKAAKVHRQQKEVSQLFKDILLNLFLMFIIFGISYGTRDDRLYRHHEDMVNGIVSPTDLLQQRFHSIKTPGDMFKWINGTVVPFLFPEFDLNGAALHWYYKTFTSNLNYMRLGPPRMRQMRIKKDSCDVPYLGKTSCYGAYFLFTEAESDYCIGWTQPPCPADQDTFNTSGDAWRFTSAFDIWGFPIPAYYTTYGGGGYIATFDVSRSISLQTIDELYNSLWLDRQTRAVFFEYTLYAPSTNAFIYNEFIVEFPETGGAFTSFSIYPIRIYNHVGSLGNFSLVCEIIFLVYLMILLSKLCVRIYQQRCNFFKQFWQVYEFVILCVGVSAVIIFFIKMGLAFLTVQKFKQNRSEFVNFAHIVFWDLILVTLMATLVFMATIRILEAFASSKKVSAIVQIFKHCGTDLFWYGMAFITLLLAFCYVGRILFGKHLESYRDILSTMTTLALALIGKSTYSDITATHPIIAQIYFMLYVMTVVFFTLTIFLSILGASIDTVVKDCNNDQNEDFIEQIIQKMKDMFVGPNGNRIANNEAIAKFRKRKLDYYPGFGPYEVYRFKRKKEKAMARFRKWMSDEENARSINHKKLPKLPIRTKLHGPVASDH